MRKGNQEQRRSSRARTILAAHVEFGNGLTVRCQVRDLSETGARITPEDAALLPDRFVLRVPTRHLARSAVVRWRHGAVLGIEFAASGETGKPGEGNEARIGALEAENAALRRRLAELADRLFALGGSDRTVGDV